MTDPIDPVAIIDIAERLGVKAATVSQWKFRGLLPEPRWIIGKTAVWSWPDVLAWAKATGRLKTDV